MSDPVPAPRLLLAAPASGHGKTTAAIALLRALQRRGMHPAACKCGPDYLDPLFHRHALGVNGYNLDLFFSTPEEVRALVRRGGQTADAVVIEGAMGYYDGAGGTATASAWHVADATETPAVLVVRPGGAMLSTAALVRGFRDFREHSRIAGVLLNRCTAPLHARLARIIEEETGVKAFGFLPDVPEAEVPGRHLGLVMPEDVPGLDDALDRLAGELEKHVDIPALLALARSAPPIAGALPPPAPERTARIAVAEDEAFCFYYRDNVEMLRELGAHIISFSPLRDSALPADADALYLGGGYPELHAARLADNAAMRRDIARAVKAGMPTLAEGGGFLYLQETLEDENGAPHPMCGALPGHGQKGDRLRRFGYVTLTAKQDCLLGPAGTSVRGHEFHYWQTREEGDACRAEKPAGGEGVSPGWNCVHASSTLFAGFPHLSFRSNPGTAAAFVRAAGRFRGGSAPGGPGGGNHP